MLLKKSWLIILLTIFLIITSCNKITSSSNKKDGAVPEMAMSDMQVTTFLSATKSADTKTIDRKIIKNAQIRFETNNLNKTKNNITDIIKKTNAYIQEENESNIENKIVNNLKVKVPAAEFNNFVNTLTYNEKNIKYKNITFDDVTDEYIDLDRRIENNKKLENRFLEILKQANKISDILEIEAKLNNIRYDIESLQSRLNKLNKNIEYSTVDITIYLVDSNSVKSLNIKNAFVKSIDKAINLLLFLITNWVYILFAIIILLIIRLLIFRAKKK